MVTNVIENISYKLKEYSYSLVEGIHFVEIPSQKYLDVIGLLKDEFSANIIIDYFGVDRSEIDGCKNCSNSIVINLLSMEYHERFIVKVMLDDKEFNLPSLNSLWKNISWYERECTEMYGFKIGEQNHYNLLLAENDSYFPLSKKFDLDSVKIDDFQTLENESILKCDRFKLFSQYYPEFSVGPFHSLLGEGPKISVNHYGEKIISCCVEVGYFHKGVEKQLESTPLADISQLIERWNSSSSILPTVAWFKTVEKSLNITIPERAQALRMIIMEFSRINDHLLKIANVTRASGSSTFYTYAHNLINIVRKSIIELTGSRLPFSYLTLGGVSSDLPKYWITNCIDTIKKIEKAILYFDKNLIKHRIWIERLSVGKGVGRDLIDRGVTGPVLRATGISYDLRKRDPYYFYNDVEFEVPLGNKGDCYDILLVRKEEILQSCTIISQILDNLPMGIYKIDEYNNSANIPSLSRKEVYDAVEGSDGEVGVYLLSDGGDVPYRVKLRSSSFPLCQYLEELLVGEKVEDITLILSSLGINCSELDR